MELEIILFQEFIASSYPGSQVCLSNHHTHLYNKYTNLDTAVNCSTVIGIIITYTRSCKKDPVMRYEIALLGAFQKHKQVVLGFSLHPPTRAVEMFQLCLNVQPTNTLILLSVFPHCYMYRSKKKPPAYPFWR